MATKRSTIHQVRPTAAKRPSGSDRKNKPIADYGVQCALMYVGLVVPDATYDTQVHNQTDLHRARRGFCLTHGGQMRETNA